MRALVAAVITCLISSCGRNGQVPPQVQQAAIRAQQKRVQQLGEQLTAAQAALSDLNQELDRQAPPIPDQEAAPAPEEDQQAAIADLQNRKQALESHLENQTTDVQARALEARLALLPLQAALSEAQADVKYWTAWSNYYTSLGFDTDEGKSAKKSLLDAQNRVAELIRQTSVAENQANQNPEFAVQEALSQTRQAEQQIDQEIERRRLILASAPTAVPSASPRQEAGRMPDPREGLDARYRATLDQESELEHQYREESEKLLQMKNGSAIPASGAWSSEHAGLPAPTGPAVGSGVLPR